ncbi:alginate export family protein [Methylicorpusculum sp.]|uniref:alginate export family protein n=3 Tax=Methylicorpusculum sp. TaxID=2713644 RepID=UPI002730A207|nr:alginate export family protein [Methylicorpusculum sp.]MDP2180275.1 alginate export family protein [Methylicorpusculum sp.]MDP3528112.1 alginate export family protein [Methylicorpusculum sp.]
MISKKTMNRQARFSRTAVYAATLLALTTAGAHATGIDEAIENALKFGQKDGKYGQVTFDLNYRYEYADTENTKPEPAHANTFRLRLGYLTPDFFGFQGFAEYENLYAAQNDYNGITSGDKDHHIVADPADKHELNQLWVSFKGIPDTLIKGGRQRIKIDDDRFIGNVGWRQMEMTYDAVMATNTSIADLTIKAGYIDGVQTITSLYDKTELPFVNVNYSLGNLGNAIAYGYWLKYEEDTALFGRSSQTYGIRTLGSPKVNDMLTLHYIAEYSYQADYENNPTSYAADRYNLMGGLTMFGITAKAGMEQLDGSGNISDRTGRGAFQTPLGTNHAFQGWADRFLVTPGGGIRDVNFTLASSVMTANLMFVYHKLSNDSGNVDYGDEYDFQITKEFGKHYSLLAKYAYYVADDNAPAFAQNDTQKIWLQGIIAF